MYQQKIYRIGGSVAVTIPHFLVEKMELKEGDSVGVDFVDGLIVVKPIKDKKDVKSK